MLHIEGHRGEGGGQILRTSLSLSLITGQPFRMTSIRAGRSKPGLMRQHLTAVLAAAEVGNATVDGASIGSTELIFRPSTVRGGDYRFAVGTAGSTSLIFQTLLPALLRAQTPSHLHLEGGTHNPMAPSFDFIERVFLRQLRRIGVDIQANLQQWGFYPAGGGQLSFQISPWVNPEPFTLLERGDLQAIWAIAALTTGLPFTIVDRELTIVRQGLGLRAEDGRPLMIRNSRSPGNVLMIGIEHQLIEELVVVLGEKGKNAEVIAKTAVDEVHSYLAHGAPVGEHLADQLLLPLAIGRGGVYRTGTPSQHTLSQIETIRRFLEVKIRCDAVNKQSWEIEVIP